MSRMAAAALAASLMVAPAWSAAPERDPQGRIVRTEDGRRVTYNDDALVPSVAAAPQPRQPAVDSPDPALFRPDMVIGSYAQMIGSAGAQVVDVDQDGLPEIAVGHSMMFYLLAWEPERNGYSQLHFTETATGATFGGGGVVELKVADLDGAPGLEMAVLMDSGQLLVYDAATGALLSTQPVLGSAQDLSVGDLAAAPGMEMAVVNASTLAVYRAGVSAALWTKAATGGIDTAVGQLDGDAALEIVVVNGTGVTSHVVDAATQLTEWSYPSGFGNFVDAGDVDGDGRDEIVAVEAWANCRAFDADSQTVKWSFANFNSGAIKAADTDGDGRDEVLLGDAQWGDVEIHDGLSGALRKSFPNPEHGVSSVDVGDVDGDCRIDVIWTAGNSSSGSDRLYVADLVSGVREWENLENDGPMHAFAAGDADGDGRTELVRACSESDAGYDGALVFTTDLHHARDEYVPAVSTNDGWMVTLGMALCQLDGDAPLEYVMNDSTTYTGKVSAFDGLTHAVQWTSAGWDGEYVAAIAAGDVTGDGLPEVVVGTGKEHTGAAGIFVRLLDGATGGLLWQSPSLSTGWGPVQDVRIADVDGDGAIEFLAATTGDGIRVWDGVTRAQEWSTVKANVTALEVGDADNDGDRDILVGDDQGWLMGWDGATKTPLASTRIAFYSIWAMRLHDIDGDLASELVVTASLDATSAYASLRVLDAATRVQQWASPSLPGRAGDGSSLHVIDADDDGQLEIAVSTAHTVRTYEYRTAPIDVAPPVFAGAPGVQAAVPTATNVCCPAIDLSWSLADDASSPPVRYAIYRDVVPVFTPSPANLAGRTPFRTFRDVGLAEGATYFYIVRALDRLGNEDGNVVTLPATTSTSPPEVSPTSSAAPLLVGKGAGTTITLSFEDLGPLATSYNVYEGTVSGWYTHLSKACN